MSYRPDDHEIVGHDVEAPDAVADDAAALIRHEMEQAYPLKVPLVAEAHVGLNWDEAH